MSGRRSAAPVSVLSALLSWALVAALLAAATGSAQAAPRPCPPDQLVTYRLDVDTHWSKQRFPKHYPLWRPTAQFSKFFGLSHNSSRVLYRVGELATPGIRQFSETGSSTGLEQLAQGQRGILDQFHAPPVKHGEGSTMARIFVDGAHSQVSLISKIVPSPDWFLGIDSVDLCDGGRWVDSVHLQLFPMDAGTDQGLTFTSPNWESQPRVPICRITAQVPKHPAGSFNYPDRKELPPLATLRLSKVRSFTLSSEFDQRDTVTYSVDTLDPSRVVSLPALQSTARLPGLRIVSASGNQTSTTERSMSPTNATTTPPPARQHHPPDARLAQVALSPPSKPSEKIASRDSSPNTVSSPPRRKSATAPSESSDEPPRRTSSASGSPLLAPGKGVASPLNTLHRDSALAKAAVGPDGSVSRVALRPDGSVARVAVRPDGPSIRIGGLRVWAVNSGARQASGAPAAGVPGQRRSSDTGSSLEGTKVPAGDRKAILDRIATHYRHRHGRRGRRRRLRRKRKRVPRDCVVGDWSDWGPCSKDCGIGETVRTRPVRVHPRRGGRPCPSLRERRWCGSARNCKRKQYFRW